MKVIRFKYDTLVSDIDIEVLEEALNYVIENYEYINNSTRSFKVKGVKCKLIKSDIRILRCWKALLFAKS